MKQKILNWLSLIGTIITVGCVTAPGSLTVQVDLFRTDGIERAPEDPQQRKIAVQNEARDLKQTLETFFQHYKIALSNRLEVAKAQANAEKDKRDGDEILSTANAVFNPRIAAADKFKSDIEAKFTELDQALDESISLAQAYQTQNPKTPLMTAGFFGKADKKIYEIRKMVRDALAPQVLGETAKKPLSTAGLTNQLDELKRKLSADPKAVEKVNATASAVKAIEGQLVPDALSGADRLQAALYLPNINPDLFVDDADPFYQVIAQNNLKAAAWSTNFFVQKADADGKVSFLIVRETPVRFSLNEAKANPAVLIKTQLRTARAGIKTMASIAKAVNPAVGAALGGASAAKGNGVPGAAAPAGGSGASNASADALNKIQKKLGEFESALKTKRDAEQAKIDAKQVEIKNKKADLEKVAPDDAQKDQKTKNLNDEISALEAEIKKIQDDLDAWAKAQFDEQVKPSLDAWGGQLKAIVKAAVGN